MDRDKWRDDRKLLWLRKLTTDPTLADKLQIVRASDSGRKGGAAGGGEAAGGRWQLATPASSASLLHRLAPPFSSTC